ncbi:MAG: hypothetical protein H0T76_21945 [Nannocystis sp.]|nr:hypothetical protein [Nannocystis sp.]MBA3549143.1 hypothetical protein [Nannocystis sp.]
MTLRSNIVAHDHRVLADQLLLPGSESVEACIAFIELGTLGVGHGRSRARMCRRLKHCPLTAQQSLRLVHHIIARLHAGNIDDQFRDHLRLAYRLGPEPLVAAARRCESDPRAYVRRQARWILSKQGR